MIHFNFRGNAHLIKVLWLSSVWMMLRCLRQVQWIHHAVVDWLLIWVNFVCKRKEENFFVQLHFVLEWKKVATTAQSKRLSCCCANFPHSFGKFDPFFTRFLSLKKKKWWKKCANAPKIFIRKMYYHFFAVYPWDRFVSLFCCIEKQKFTKNGNEHQFQNQMKSFYRKQQNANHKRIGKRLLFIRKWPN